MRRAPHTVTTPAWHASPLFGWACIALLGVMVYGHTLQVPWYFDDLPNIVDNPALRDLGQATRNLLSVGRGPAYWTFALNYRFGGLAVGGYHLVNITIHILSAGIVFLILRRLLPPLSWLPLLGALLFLVHPLQTQAVTYIVQRMTSLSGLCFFLSLALYQRAREERARTDAFLALRHSLLYLGALLSGALAVLIKENAAILPLALLVYDVYFLPDTGRQPWKYRLLYLLPFCIAPFGVAVTELLGPLLHGGGLAEIGGVRPLVSQKNLTPLNYLGTEFSVLWLYIRLLFLPFGQALDYSYPVVATIFTARTFLALAGLVGLLTGAVVWRRKAPLVSFGIVWFLLCLSVESSFIPLDPVFEHRLYVPLFGFVLVLIGLVQQWLLPRRAELLLLLLLPPLAFLAWQRNALWNDPIAFYQSNLRQVPESERVNVALAKQYLDASRYDQAEPLLRTALRLNPGYVDAYVNLSVILIERGEYAAALALLGKGVELNPRSVKLNDNLGTLYDKLGQPELALLHLQRAVALDPAYAKAHLNLGAVYAEHGEEQAAIAEYNKAIALSDTYADAHFNLGVIYQRQQRWREAREEFQMASAQAPDDAEALYNLASVSLELGQKAEAAALLPRLLRLDRQLAEALQRRL